MLKKSLGDRSNLFLNCFLIVAILAGGYFLKDPIFYYTDSYFFQKAFMTKLDESVKGEKEFDLRDYKPGAWDEIVWVSPYEKPCHQENKNFRKWWLFCRGAQADNEFKIFFLKAGVPRAGFRVLRYSLELIESNIPTQIPREKARFKLDHFENFPTVQMIEP